MVGLELVVLSPSYIFLTEVVLTRRFHFFVQANIPMPMTRKLSESSLMRRLKRIATFGSIILPKLTRKEKPRRWVTLKIEGFTEKAQTKLLVHRVQNSECKFQGWARNLTPEFHAGNVFELVCFLKLLWSSVSLVLPATFIWSCHNLNKLSRFQFFFIWIISSPYFRFLCIYFIV